MNEESTIEFMRYGARARPVRTDHKEYTSGKES